jgi:hypothetical protein
MMQRTLGATVHVGPAGPGSSTIAVRAVICSTRMHGSVRRAISYVSPFVCLASGRMTPGVVDRCAIVAR